MSTVYLAVGSVFGSASGVAEALRERLQQAGHQVVLDQKASVAALNASQCDAILVCTSTTGRGDVPGNLVNFYSELGDLFPLQHGKPFGVISLGSSGYADTFCQAGQLFEERLLELQATQAVPRITLDDTETMTPEDDALFWLDEWMAAALA